MKNNWNRYTLHLNQQPIEKKIRTETKYVNKQHVVIKNTIDKYEFKSYGIVSGYKGANTYNVYIDHQEAIYKLVKEKHQMRLIVGDKILLNTQDEIYDYLPRSSHLVRLRGDNTRKNSLYQKNDHIIAANIDLAVIVTTAAEPVFSPGIIDRYLLLCQYGNIKPLICLNKCDITNSRHHMLEWYRNKLGVNVVETSVKNDTGIEELKRNILGKSAVLIGVSGVGKSSIINKLLGISIKTQNISSKSKKGRHTTTTSNLYALEEGYIIDTPGIRSLDVSMINLHELKNFFPDFKDLSQKCRYKNCLHINEDNCAVKAMQEDFDIKLRYQTYLRIIKSINTV